MWKNTAKWTGIDFFLVYLFNNSPPNVWNMALICVSIQQITASPNINKRNRQLAVTYGTGRRTFRLLPAHSVGYIAVKMHSAWLT